MEDAWLHPPRTLIGQTIRRLMISRARDTILVPDKQELMWWPLVVEGATGTCVFPTSNPTLAGKPMRKRWAPEHGLLAKAGELMPLGDHDLLAIRLDFREEARTSTTSPPWRAAARELSVDVRRSTPRSATV